MIFYIPALIFLIYRLYKSRTKTTVVLILLCLVSGAFYMGAENYFIEPVHVIFPAVAIAFSLYLIYLSRREYTNARSEYLKERRMAREAAEHEAETGDEHERIVITNDKSDEEKVIYLKRSEKNVPHGTIDETKQNVEEKN